MPTLNIGGKKIKVDDTFLSLSPDEQNAAVAEIAKSLPAMVDPATNQPVGVPEFKPVGVEGYNPQTGEVERSKLSSAASGAADTMTFGFGDELASVPASMLSGVPQDQVLREMRTNQKDARADNPKSYMAGQLGGAVAQGLATRGASFMPNAISLGGKVLGGALTGAAYGGVYGAGSGEGLQDRGIEAVKGALIGGATGGAFPLVAAGVSTAYSKIADAIMGNRAASSAGYSPETLRMLGDVMEADGTLGPTGRANMAAAGHDAMLADAGPNAKAVLDTAIQRGGPGAVGARQAIAERSDRAASAIGDTLDNTLGSPEGVTAARTAIRVGSAPARSAAYDAAYAAPIDYAAPRGQAIEEIIKTRVPPNAIAEANALMRAEGNQSKQILAKIADDGSVVFEQLPDVRQLDYITRGLNEVADQADGAGKLGGTTAKGRAYSLLSGEIRDHLRDLVPEYGNALETAADPIRRSKAVELGSKLLSASTTRDQAAEAVSGMTGAEKDALAQGIRSRLDDMMANVTRTVQDGETPAREAIKAIKDLSSRANREKLAMAIGQQRADALFADIDQAARSFDLRAAVAENSKTYARQATAQRVQDITAPGIVGTAAQGEPINAVKRIVQAMTGQTPGAMAQRQNGFYSELASALTQNPGQSQAVFDAINGLSNSTRNNKLITDRIAAALSGQHLAYPSTLLLRDRLQQ